MDLTYNKEADKVKYTCPNCGGDVESDLTGFISELVSEESGGDYSNLAVECPCGATTYFNLNIPEAENAELDLEEGFLLYDQINARKNLRDLLWAKREDLKTQDREAYNERYLQNAPDHIKNLVKRNNMVNSLLGTISYNHALTEEQTKAVKNLAMQIVTGQISLLKGLEVLTQYFKQGTP